MRTPPLRPRRKLLELKRRNAAAVEAAAAKWALEGAGHRVDIAFAEFWAASLRQGVRLPCRRSHRRVQFERALQRFPDPKHAAERALFVGLSPRQFRASALRYGLVEPKRRSRGGAR